MTRAAIVTGGGTGLGRGTAEALAEAGVDCLLAGRRAEPLEATRAALAEAPGRIEAVVADVTDAGDRERLVRACLERFGRLDILVNNAGGGSAAQLLDFSEAAWRDGFAVNVDAPFALSQLAIPEMRRNGWGRIVNIASILGLAAGQPAAYDFPDETASERGPWRAPAYAASKAAIVNLTRELAAAVAPWGITVNAISPGYIERPERPRPAATVERIASRTPVGRLGEPRDVGYAVRYLASEEASFVTGANLVVDGGWTIWSATRRRWRCGATPRRGRRSARPPAGRRRGRRSAARR